MARLYVFVEGSTEQTFVSTMLAPQLAAVQVFIQGPILIAHARRRGIVHRGGGRHYEPMRNDIQRFLKQERSTDVFFTTMIDLYAIHPNFPLLDESRKLANAPYKRVEFLEQAFAEDIGDKRFIPYIQLHEYEAVLFSDPSHFQSFYPGQAGSISELQNIASSVESPELINDGKDTAPSKRIIQRFPDYEGAKPVIGLQVAQNIGLQRIREKCPHFNSWVSRLETLAQT